MPIGLNRKLGLGDGTAWGPAAQRFGPCIACGTKDGSKGGFWGFPSYFKQSEWFDSEKVSDTAELCHNHYLRVVINWRKAKEDKSAKMDTFGDRIDEGYHHRTHIPIGTLCYKLGCTNVATSSGSKTGWKRISKIVGVQRQTRRYMCPDHRSEVTIGRRLVSEAKRVPIGTRYFNKECISVADEISQSNRNNWWTFKLKTEGPIVQGKWACYD